MLLGNISPYMRIAVADSPSDGQAKTLILVAEKSVDSVTMTALIR